MATFLENISQFSRNLQSNPNFQVARMRGRGLPEESIMRQEQSLRNQQALQQQEQQFVDIVQAIGDRDPTREELLVLHSLNPDATEMLAEDRKRRAMAGMSISDPVLPDILLQQGDIEGARAVMQQQRLAEKQDIMNQILSGGASGADERGGLSNMSDEQLMLLATDPEYGKMAELALRSRQDKIQFENQLRRDELKAQRNMEAQAAKPTEAQKSIDKEFGKEYATYKASGGQADVLKNLDQLDSVIADLEANPDLTGAKYSVLPDVVQDVLTPNSKDAKERVEEVVQRNLRLVLGAQFTQKEGDRLISRAYNQNLPADKNIERVKRLKAQIVLAAQAKADAARYYEENGTLVGWEGKIPTLADFEAAIEGGAGEGAAKYKEGMTATNPQTGQKIIFRNGKWEAM